MTRSKSVNNEDIPLTEEEEAAEDARILAGIVLKKELDKLKARTDGSETLQELVAPYSEEERGTWGIQEAEAMEYQDNNNAPCVMIRRIAYHRGIEVSELVVKIMDNVELFKYVAGDILGVQQKAIDDIETG